MSHRKRCGWDKRVSYRPGLPHLAYFRALATESSEQNATWRSALAGLVAMRLVDTWADGHALPDAGLRALECGIHMVDVDAPERVALQQLRDVLVAEQCGSQIDGESRVLACVRDYAEALWQSASWSLAIDVCRTIIARARTPGERAILPATYHRLGYCLRMRGRFEAAAEAFQAGRVAARGLGNTEYDLRFRIAEARLETDRNNPAIAELLLDEVIEDATHAALPKVRARAMHDKGTIAYRRDDYGSALTLYLDALDDYADDERGTDRLLADIALAFQGLGNHEIAREILQGLTQYSVEKSQQWTATVNLMRLEAEAGDEARFNAIRRSLIGERLTPRNRAHYYLIVADAWDHFGRRSLAQRAHNRAGMVIRRHGLRDLQPTFDTQAAMLKENRAPAQSAIPTCVADQTTHDLQPFVLRASVAATRWSSTRQRQSAPTHISVAEPIAT